MSDIPEKLSIPHWEFRVAIGNNRIDYDVNKEHINRQKHGYSLESAVSLLESLILPLRRSPFITSDGFLQAGDVRHMHMAVDDCGKVVLMELPGFCGHPKSAMKVPGVLDVQEATERICSSCV